MSIFRTAQVITLGAMLSSMTLFCSAPTPAIVAAYQGEWVSADRTVRQRLLPNNRYEETHGASTYRGTYHIRGEHIEYHDDTGFTADGDFLDGALHQSGIVMLKEQ